MINPEILVFVSIYLIFVLSSLFIIKLVFKDRVFIGMALIPVANIIFTIIMSLFLLACILEDLVKKLTPKKFNPYEKLCNWIEK